MSTMQLVIAGIGVLIFFSGTDLSKIKSTIKNYIPTIPANPIAPATPTVQPAPSIDDSGELVDVVKKWDDLKDTCEGLGLKEAVDKLNEIFPLLIKADK